MRLIDKLRSEIAEEHQSEITQLVSNDLDGNQPSKHGFSQACAESRAAHLVQVEETAIRELKGHHLSTPNEIRSFRERYLDLGRTRIDEIIDRYDPDGRR